MNNNNFPSRLKVCPNCNKQDVNISLKKCDNCNYKFKMPKYY